MTSFFAGSALNTTQTQHVEDLLDELRNNDWKQSCVAASTANTSVSSAATTLDGVTLAVNDRILLKDQTAAAENGIWVYAGAAVPLVRAGDADMSEHVTSGLTVLITKGTVNSDRMFKCTTADPITLGSTALAFDHYTGAVGKTVEIAGFIEGPTAKSYTLIAKNREVFTIDEIYLDTSAGTCLATIEVNGSPVAGLTSIAVVSTGVTAAASGTVTVSADDRVVLTLASIVSATNLEFDLKGTR